MNRKIKCFINGEYQFTTAKYKTCKELIKEIRNAVHLEIASIPAVRYLTVNEYGKIVCRYAD